VQFIQLSSYGNKNKICTTAAGFVDCSNFSVFILLITDRVLSWPSSWSLLRWFFF
jgi:hypothetical protein